MCKYKHLFIIISILLMMIGVSCTGNIPTPNDSANLTVLVFSEGILLPSFDSETMNYSFGVEYITDTIHFTAISEDNQAYIKYRWQAEGESWSKWYDISSGMASSDLTLKTGDNTIEIFVESSGGTDFKTYTIIINRQETSSQNIAELNNLEAIYTYGSTDYPLLYKPLFNSNTTEYNLFLVARAHTLGKIFVLPTIGIVPSSDLGTIQINGEEVVSGEKKIYLFTSSTVYEIMVTAPDGVTTETYYLNAYNYSSINQAVEYNFDLSDGDIITAVPGLYEEDSEVIFPDKEIYLMSLDPQDSTIRDNTIIDGGDAHRVIAIKYLDKTPTLSGFTIQNGSDYNGSGIYIYLASPNILYNKIISNHQPGTDYGSRGGIYVYDGSPNISYNTISGNENGYGAGINISGESSPQIEHNNIQSNYARYFGGGINLDTVTGTPKILYNTISYNDAGNHGGGICCIHSSPLIQSNANISDNKADMFGGGICIMSCSPEVKNNQICDNWAIQHGGGIYISGEDSEPEIVDNVKILGNEFGQWIKNPDDIYIGSGNPIISNNGGPPVILP